MWQPTFQEWVLIGLGGVVVLFLSMARFRFAMLTLAVQLAATTLAPLRDWQDRPMHTWLSPVQSQRTPIFAIAGLMLLATATFHLPRIKLQRVAGPAVCMLLIGVYAGLVRTIMTEPTSGVISIAFAIVTILPGVIVIPALLEDREDLFRMLRLIGFVSAAWAGACIVQFFVRRSMLNLGGGYTRFNGMLGNPQHAATYLGVAVTVCVFLLLNDPVHRWKPLWAALVGLNSVMLIWTASRTGVGMAVIGCAAVLYARLGRAVLLGPVAVLVGLLALNALEAAGIQIGFERFVGGENTRARAWQTLISQFLASPAFGTGAAEETRFSENSYLFGPATYGIGMAGLIGMLLISGCVQSIRLIRVRSALDPIDRRLCELVLGFMGMYFAGAFFEGYIVSRVSTSLMFMLIFASIGATMLRFARESHAVADAPDPSDSWTPDSEYADLSDSYGRDQAGDPSDSRGRSVA